MMDSSGRVLRATRRALTTMHDDTNLDGRQRLSETGTTVYMARIRRASTVREEARPRPYVYVNEALR